MELDTILFWVVCLSCASALVRALIHFRTLDPGWIVTFLLILGVTGAGGWWNFKPAVYAGGALWAVLVLIPALLSHLYLRLFLQQRYRAARRLAQVTSWLHPSRSWRQQTRILRALELAYAGDIAAAVEILQSQQNARGMLAATAIANFYRLTNQWENCAAWLEQQGDLRQKPQLIPIALRARGEVGDPAGMVNLFDQCGKQIARLEPAVQRHLCRLVLFAFCGRHGPVQRLLTGPLAMMPSSAREFWLGTTELAAGLQDEGQDRLSTLAATADPVTRHAIERRLSHSLTIAEPSLTAEQSLVLARAEEDYGHEVQFTGRPSLFSKPARACQLFLALNVLAFLVEMKMGGSTNLTVLFRLGGLAPQTGPRGEWWRLVTANFLHYGPLHLTMNMLGLWALGPSVELALGFRRFSLVYLFSGVGSMGIVLTWMVLTGKDELLIGASACVMGLIGSTGAILLRGWQQQRARIAARRLVSVLFIVGLQTLLDWVIPQVSMMAHLSGVFIGFLTTLLFKLDSRTPPTAASDGQ